MGSGNGFEVKLPGRQFWLKRVENFDEGDQLSDVWCTRLALMPEQAMDSDQTLTWPDHHGPLVGSGIMGGFDVMEEAYIRDEVLLDYENRPEFDTIRKMALWAITAGGLSVTAGASEAIILGLSLESYLRTRNSR